MKLKSLGKVIGAAALTLSCGFGAVGCAQASGAASVPEGAAATVGAVSIDEAQVTSYVENFRATQELSSEDSWGAWLVENELTPETLRDQAVYYYASQELLRQAAAENGIVADSSEVDAQMQDVRSKYESDDAWRAALTQAGITEDEQRSLTELMLLQERLTAQVVSDAELTDEELLSSVQLYASACDGAKRSSHILFAADDESTAREVLGKIERGELSFEDAAHTYSIDVSSAERGGDVGWDKMSSLDASYQAALDGLEPNQTSEPVASSFGIHLIRCTDQLHVPDQVTSVDQVSSGFVETVRSLSRASAQKQAFSTWMQEYEDRVGVNVATMPDGVSYNIDLTPYEDAAPALSESEKTMPLAPDLHEKEM